MRALEDDDVEVARRAAARAAARRPRRGQSQVCARPRPSGPRSGRTGTRYLWRPGRTRSSTSRARARAGSSCGRRPAGGEPLDGVEHVVDASRRPGTGARRPGRRAPGSPRTGRRRTAARAARRHGRQRAAGTVGANSDTTGVPTAAARWAGPVLPTTTASGAGEHAGQLGERRRAAEVERRASPATYARQLALARPAGDHDLAARRRQRRDELARSARAPTPAPGPTPRGGRRRRAAGSVERAARRRHDRRRPSSPGGSAKPAAAGERQRALDLVDVVGIAVAQVEQRAGVVVADRADPAARRRAAAAARSAAGSGGTRSRQRAVDRAARRAASTSASTSAAVDRRGSGSIHGARQHEHLVDAGQQPAAWPPARAAQQRHVVGAGGDRADRRAGEQDVAVVVEPDDERRGSCRAPRAAASTAAARSARAPRARRATSSARVRGVGTSTAARPAARAASTSAPMSPITRSRAGRRRARAAARSDQAGRGLAAAQPSSGPVRAVSRAARTGRAAPPCGR